jgi:hypothetical protein
MSTSEVPTFRHFDRLVGRFDCSTKIHMHGNESSSQQMFSPRLHEQRYLDQKARCTVPRHIRT